MNLDESELKEGLEYIVGTWQPDYVVSFFSNNLEHIPASQFKSDDGRDFTALKFEFFEDHTVLLTDGDKTEKGTWEQTGRYDYHYTFDAFLNLPEGEFKEKAENLTVQDCRLVFSIGFLVIALEKTAEGFVTREKDVGEIEMTEEEARADAIVGRYIIKKAISMIGEDFGLYTREEVEADLKKRGESAEEARDTLSIFDVRYEITPDHKFSMYQKIPEGVSQKEIDEAIRSGQISEVVDGYFPVGSMPWKYVNGKYYYDTGEERSLFDKPVSSWEELCFNEEGLLPINSGFALLERVK